MGKDMDRKFFLLSLTSLRLQLLLISSFCILGRRKKQLVMALTCHAGSVRLPPVFPLLGHRIPVVLTLALSFFLFREAVLGIYSFKGCTSTIFIRREYGKLLQKVMCCIYLAERVVWSKFLKTVGINQESLCHISSLCSQNTDPTIQNQNAVCRPGNQSHSLYAFTAHLRNEIRRPTER